MSSTLMPLAFAILLAAPPSPANVPNMATQAAQMHMQHMHLQHMAAQRSAAAAAAAAKRREWVEGATRQAALSAPAPLAAPAGEAWVLPFNENRVFAAEADLVVFVAKGSRKELVGVERTSGAERV